MVNTVTNTAFDIFPPYKIQIMIKAQMTTDIKFKTGTLKIKYAIVVTAKKIEQPPKTLFGSAFFR